MRWVNQQWKEKLWLSISVKNAGAGCACTLWRRCAPAIGAGTSPASDGRLNASGHRPAGLRLPRTVASTQRQTKGKNQHERKSPWSLQLRTGRRTNSRHRPPAPEGIAAEIQFREDLWREYRCEAINAGFSTAQATEYASALSPEMGLVVGVSEMAPAARGWFYQSRAGVVWRTMISGLITLTQWEKSKATGRTEPRAPRIFARRLRSWNAGRKS